MTEEYIKYLKSDRWKRVRKKIIFRDMNMCVNCRSQKILQVHHLSYTSIFDESESDLVTLCKKCHNKWHDGLLTKKEMRIIRRHGRPINPKTGYAYKPYGVQKIKTKKVLNEVKKKKKYTKEQWNRIIERRKARKRKKR